MQQKIITKKRRLKILLLLSVCLFISTYKDLKKGFVEGYSSYNAIKSIHSKQQSNIDETDFLGIRLLLFNKIY